MVRNGKIVFLSYRDMENREKSFFHFLHFVVTFILREKFFFGLKGVKKNLDGKNREKFRWGYEQYGKKWIKIMK